MDISGLEAKNTVFHIPRYQFCCPGIKVFTRLNSEDKGINKLDEAIIIHVIEYLK